MVFYWKKNDSKNKWFAKQQKRYDHDHILALFIRCLATLWFYAISVLCW
ncbi:hypothetical protein [Spiroplasma phoeniceum]|nr:hypothetical protein [Spiroplasma phoeniceum]